MNKILQNQLKDKVISLLLDKTIALDKIVCQLKEENNYLQNQLVHCLKNVYIIKEVMNIQLPLTKFLNIQTNQVKSSVCRHSKEAMNLLLKQELPKKNNSSPIVINKKKPYLIPKTERYNSASTSKKKNISNINNSYLNNTKNPLSISTYHAKFSNNYFSHYNLKQKFICQTTTKKNNVLNLSISSSNSQYLKSKNNSKSRYCSKKVDKSNKVYLNNKKRNLSMPKLSLSKILKNTE